MARICSYLLAAALLAGNAEAVPALFGSSGLIRIPTAYTLEKGQVDAAVDVHQIRMPGARADETYIHGRAVAGLLDDADNGLELGIHTVTVNGGAGAGSALTGKYRFEGALPLGSVAVGGRLQFGGREQNSVYIVGSTNAAESFAVHYGMGVNFNTGRGVFSYYGGKDGLLESDRFFPMFGAELDIDDSLKLNADYNGDTAAFGINYWAAEDVVVSVFYLGNGDYERITGGTESIGAGVTVQF